METEAILYNAVGFIVAGSFFLLAVILAARK
jgi:hypothetical protein